MRSEYTANLENIYTHNNAVTLTDRLRKIGGFSRINGKIQYNGTIATQGCLQMRGEDTGGIIDTCSDCYTFALTNRS